jgi:hypothetical protein
LPQAVVSQGNVLLVTWETDNGVGNNGAWYAYLVLDIPASPVMPLPTVASTPTIMPTQTSTPPLRTPAPRHERAVFQDSPATRGGGDRPFAVPSNPISPLITAIVPVVLLISLLVLIQRLFRRNHY